MERVVGLPPPASRGQHSRDHPVLETLNGTRRPLALISHYPGMALR